MLEERIKRSGRPPTAASMDMSESRAPSVASSRAKRYEFNASLCVYLSCFRLLNPHIVFYREHSEPRQVIETMRMAPKWIEPVSAAQQRARAMLSELGDLSPVKAPNMPDLIQLDADISDVFKPIEVPTLK